MATETKETKTQPAKLRYRPTAKGLEKSATHDSSSDLSQFILAGPPTTNGSTRQQFMDHFTELADGTMTMIHDGSLPEGANVDLWMGTAEQFIEIGLCVDMLIRQALKKRWMEIVEEK